MKTLFILFLFISGNIFAQDNYRTTKSMQVMMNLTGNVKSVKETSYQAVVKNGVVEKGKKKRQKSSWEFPDEYDFFDEFNTDGNFSQKTYYKPTGEVERKIVYSYDDHHSVTKESRLNAAGVETSSSSFEYSYDANGNKTERRNHRQEGDISKTIYKYDSAGNLIREEDYDSTKLKYYTDFTYNDAQQLTEMSGTGFDGRGIMKQTYAYDAAGNISEENWYLNGAYYMKYTYKYDAHKNITERAWYNAKGKLGITWTFTYEYDAQGNWVKKVEYANGKAQYVFEREITYY